MKRLQITIQDDLYDALNETAVSTYNSKSAIINQALNKYLRKEFKGSSKITENKKNN